MTQRWNLVLAAIVLVGPRPPSMYGADKARVHVLVVGIDKYRDPQILTRRHAEADARALFELLGNKEYVESETGQRDLLLGRPDPKGPGKLATRANILDALGRLAEGAGANDLVLIAYFGQGASLGSRACYFSLDSTFKGRGGDALAAGDVEDALRKLKSRRVCVFLDVNFLGFDAGKETPPDPELNNFYREWLGADGLAGRNGRSLVLANTGLKPSLDLADHGILAQTLLDGLKGEADTDGYEPDGLVTVAELNAFVRTALPRLARTDGKTEAEKSQVPLILEQQGCTFAVVRNPAVAPAVERRCAAFERLSRAQSLTAELMAEGHELLARMPALSSRQDLRKAYQGFADRRLNVNELRAKRDGIIERARLPQKEAAAYAKLVLVASDRIREWDICSLEEEPLLASAVIGLYRHLDEKLSPSIQDRLDKINDLTRPERLRLLTEARQALGKREDLPEDRDIALSVRAMLNPVDRDADYIDRATIERFTPRPHGNFFGVGLQMRKHNARDMIEVVTPIKGSPAHKAGVHAGDIIIALVRDTGLDGTPLAKPETISTQGLVLDEFVRMLLGEQGTRLKLIVEREGRQEPLEIVMVRGLVAVESILGHRRQDKVADWDYLIDPKHRIGYIRVNQFSSNTAPEIERVVRDLSAGGLKGLVLDLRFCPGGLLNSAIKVADLFIGDGLIVTIRQRKKPETAYIGKLPGSRTDFPLVCLINGSSAAGSEIVAACLQDHKRAVVMGSRSYGRGSVQSLLPLESGGELKLTIASFLRANGRNINRSNATEKSDDWGVIPDRGFALDLPARELNMLQDCLREREIIRRPGLRDNTSVNAFRDRQLEMAVEHLRRLSKSTVPK